MFRFKSNIKSASRLFLTIFVLLSFGLLACGCATLYIQPAVVQQDSVAVTVAVDEPKGANGLAIVGFPPKTIRIIPKRAGQWDEPIDVNLRKGKYRQTFDDVEAYKIDKGGLFIAFEVGQGAGPYKKPSIAPQSAAPQSVSPSPPEVPSYRKGYNRAREYLKGQVQDYRIVIELYLLSPPERDKFLMGFQVGYMWSDDRAQGQKYVNNLKQSLTGGVYEQAFELGKKHVNGQVTNEFIQDTIERSLGLGGFELGWKAGYIEGFVQGKLKPEEHDKETLYQQAEARYRMLKEALEL